MKIKEMTDYTSLITSINIPHLEELNISPSELSFFLKFRYGERHLLKEVADILHTPDETYLGKLIQATYNPKWEQNFKALTSEYEVLYSNRVVYDETRDSDQSDTATHTSSQTGSNTGNSSNDVTSKVTAFDSVSDYDDNTKNLETTSHTASTTNQENIDSVNNSVVNYKRGYTKQYSNGLDGATAIEKDIAIRKSKYIEIVLHDIVNHVSLSIF